MLGAESASKSKGAPPPAPAPMGSSYGVGSFTYQLAILLHIARSYNYYNS